MVISWQFGQTLTVSTLRHRFARMRKTRGSSLALAALALGICLYLKVQPAWALTLPSQAVVKIRSSDPVTEAAREGSGLIFRCGQQLFVLTSDHVVFHDNQHEHRLSNASWGLLSARFRFADWGRGIALLEVLTPPQVLLAAGAVPEYSELVAVDHADGEASIVYGYPAQTEMLVVDKRGAAQSVFMSTLMASIRQMIFLGHGYAEFGMSGGPVMTQDGRFLGILSHLLFWTEQQRPGNWTSGQKPNEHVEVLIVPFAELKDVLSDDLDKGRHEKVTLVDADEPSQANEVKVRCSRLQFDSQLDSQGFLTAMSVHLLPTPATSFCPFQTPGRSPYQALEGILQKQSGSNAIGAKVVGVRMERVFRFATFQQVDIQGFHMFVTTIEWSNIRGVFMHRKPESADLKKALTSFIGEIDTLLRTEKTLGTFWRERLAELKTNFGASIQDASADDWTAAHPSGINEVLASDPERTGGSAAARALLIKLREFTSLYLY